MRKLTGLIAGIFLLTAIMFAFMYHPIAAQESGTVPPLNRMFVTRDETFAFSYPARWYYYAIRGKYSISNNENAFWDGFPYTPNIVTINFYSPGLISSLIPAGISLEEMPVALLVATGGNVEETILESPIPHQVREFPAIITFFTEADREGILLFYQMPDGSFVGAEMITGTGGSGDFMTSFIMIVESSVYSPDGGAKSVLTPTPAPTETPAPLVLTETHTTADSALSFNYPTGWVTAEDEGLILLGNVPQVAEVDKLEPGMAGAFIISPAAMAQIYSPGTSLNIMAQSFIDGLNTDLDEGEIPIATIDSPQRLTLNYKPAVRQRIVADGEEGAILVIEVAAGRQVLMYTATYQGEYQLTEPTFLAIAESMTYSFPIAAPIPTVAAAPALALNESHEAKSYGLAFDYPSGWQVDDQVSYLRVINQADVTAPDAVQVAIFPPLPYSNYATMYRVAQNTPATDILQAYLKVTVPDVEGIYPGELYEGTVNGYQAARAMVRLPGGDSLYYLIKYPDNQVVVVIASSGIYQMPAFQATVEELVKTIRLLEVDPLIAVTDPPVLSQSYFSLQYGLTFNYPARWLIQESEAYLSATNRRPAPREESGYVEGELEFLILVPEAYDSVVPPGFNGDMANALQTYTDRMAGYTDMEFDDLTETSVNGYPAVKRAYKDATRNIEGYLLLVNYGGQYVMMAPAARLDGFESLAAIAQAMVESVHPYPPVVVPPVTTEPAESSAADSSREMDMPEAEATKEAGASEEAVPLGESGSEG